MATRLERRKLMKKTTFKVGRWADNGRFTTVEKAKRHKKTAIVETIHKR